jgi:head-tail adaptor
MKQKLYDAGRLRYRFSLERPVRTTDGQGGYSLTYADEGEVWADWKEGRVSVVSRDGRKDGILRHSLRLRYRSDIEAGWRLTSGTRLLIVTALSPTPDSRFLDLQLEEEDQ